MLVRTIVCADHGLGRFRYVLEFRHMFGKYPTGWQHTPDWAIREEHYLLGFYPPRHPLPSNIEEME